jgi:hypothetical protein
MKTSESTHIIAQEAFRAGLEDLPDYRHPKSPKKFTQPQLSACLVVKEFLQLDCRGGHALLREWSDLREVLWLTKAAFHHLVCRR